MQDDPLSPPPPQPLLKNSYTFKPQMAFIMFTKNECLSILYFESKKNFFT